MRETPFSVIRQLTDSHYTAATLEVHLIGPIKQIRRRVRVELGSLSQQPCDPELRRSLQRPISRRHAQPNRYYPNCKTCRRDQAFADLLRRQDQARRWLRDHDLREIGPCLSSIYHTFLRDFKVEYIKVLGALEMWNTEGKPYELSQDCTCDTR